jgi:DNA-binding MarR family transcriptional regulator
VSYGYVLLAVRDAPMTTTALAGALGVTKQAASKLLDPMVAGGYVSRRTDEHDRRSKAVAITPRGSELLGVVEEVYVELEAALGAAIGRRRLDDLRDGLTALAGTIDDDAARVLRPA